MSVDKLQDRIRKLKNPSVLDLSYSADQVPPYILGEEETPIRAYGKYCLELMDGLKGLIPAVRFHFSSFAIAGPEALNILQYLMNRAGEAGYYVLLDSPEALSSQAAEAIADAVFSMPCDGFVVSAYIGSDAVKPFVKKLKGSGKSLFVVIRTANKSASELQDLMTGSRLAYMASADLVNRLGEPLPSRCGYSQIAGVGPASSADCLRALRSKFKGMFLLVEGLDYPNSNAKNCSFAFDKLGHGAAVCAGSSVCTAWMNEGVEPGDHVQAAVQVAERVKKNLTRYITVL